MYSEKDNHGNMSASHVSRPTRRVSYRYEDKKKQTMQFQKQVPPTRRTIFASNALFCMYTNQPAVTPHCVTYKHTQEANKAL